MMRFTGNTVPKRIGHVSHSNQLRAGREELQKLIEQQLAPTVDRRDFQGAAGLLAHHLPGHDVGVMLQAGDEDLIPWLEARARIGLRDQVYPFGGAPNENDLASRACVDEAPDALPRSLVSLGCGLAESVHTPVNVRVRVGLVVFNRSQYAQRSLRRGGAIKIDERPAIDGALQDREVLTHAFDVEGLRGIRQFRCGRRHYNNSFSASASCICPARLRSICRRSSGTSIRATTSSRNAHFNRRCAVARSIPRDSR